MNPQTFSTFHRRIGRGWLIFMLVLAACTCAADQPNVIAYVPNWIDIPAFSRTIAYEKLTHINIAFENPINSLGDLSFDHKNEALIAEAHAHHVKVCVSIGGGSASTDKKLKARYFSLLSDSSRASFVARVATYLVEHHLDGLDVDIEGPSINKDYGLLIHDLSLAIRPKKLLLTAALSQGYGGEHVPSSVFGDLDFVNIMAYDATGPWEPQSPGPHSSLDFAKSNVAYWLDRGLPKSKANLGLPFYGYGFGKAFRKSDYSYAAIVAAHPGAETVDVIGSTIYYNGVPTIQAKTRFAIEQGLAGVMIWSLDCDADGPASLLTAVNQTIRDAASRKEKQ